MCTRVARAGRWYPGRVGRRYPGQGSTLWAELPWFSLGKSYLVLLREEEVLPREEESLSGRGIPLGQSYCGTESTQAQKPELFSGREAWVILGQGSLSYCGTESTQAQDEALRKQEEDGFLGYSTSGRRAVPGPECTLITLSPLINR